MPRQHPYKTFEALVLSKKLAVACYELTHELSPEEKTNFSRYLRSAAVTVHVNLSQCIYMKEKKREKHLLEVRNGLVIIDAATEILVEVGLTTRDAAEAIPRYTAALSQLLHDL